MSDEKHKTAHNKKAFIAAYLESMCNVSTACEASGIGRRTYYTWLKEDATFKQDVDDASEFQKDFVESKLMGLINDGDTACTIFFAKTKMRDRGYSERDERDKEGSEVQILRFGTTEYQIKKQ